MNKQEIINLQIHLAELGFYRGDIDGIAGPQTTQAYESYWASRPVEQTVPIVTPDPATPWWTSRGIWGSLLVLASFPARGLFGLEYDPTEATDILMPLINLIPDAMVAIGGLMAYFGRKNAKAPIDPTLVGRHRGQPVRFGLQHRPLHPTPESKQRDFFTGGSD